MLPNPIRGEAVVKIGEVEVHLATTMQGLAKLSARQGCQTLQDLYARALGVELNLVYDVLAAFTQKAILPDGEELKGAKAVKAASEAYTLSDSDAMQAALSTLLLAFTRKREDSDTEGDTQGN